MSTTNTLKEIITAFKKGFIYEVWEKIIGEQYNGNCYVCQKVISCKNYHCAHIIAERNGGITELNNLQVTCARCNLSCATMNLDDLKQMFNNNKKLK